MADGFDPGKVADLAKAMAMQVDTVRELREESDAARSKLNSAEVRLANLRAEFTRAIDGQLDMSTLKQRPREGHPA